MKKGFTLIELLIVMSIIGVLASIGVGSFMTAQMRGRDAARKSDLKQIASALELFYADYGRYPAESTRYIAACSYDPATSTGNACTWGTDSFTDGKTTYFKTIPADPSSKSSTPNAIYYRYNVVALSSNQKYQLFAYLENDKDQDIDTDLIARNLSCGTGKICNFAVTSANTNSTE